MKTHLLILSALCAAIPLALLIPGCSGGDSSLFTPSKSYNSNFALSATQAARLALRVQGKQVTGTVAVLAPVGVQNRTAQDRTAQDVSFSVPVGTYSFSGTLTPPASFSGSGTFPSPIGAFSISGQVPASGGNGTFTLTVNGETTTGTFSTTTTTATARPTVTTTATATARPTVTTTATATATATARPTATVRPTATAQPSAQPSAQPTTQPTFFPTPAPTPRP